MSASFPGSGSACTFRRVTRRALLALSLMAAASGAWSFTVTPAPATGFQSNLTVTATDIAGNVSTSPPAGVVVGTGVAAGP